ncbi:GumC domain-containing protein [Haploplasma axanthum]|uniref:Uncharacterized protein n=1 Tax=Haploplasma axanthum TaxID=29552 RepID=A0A449BE69_HAPAX|nr:hypothetical protein [Haploplasma axanthum]VEU80754.1 Uncharacterised protein [Haploplasma axanthum]
MSEKTITGLINQLNNINFESTTEEQLIKDKLLSIFSTCFIDELKINKDIDLLQKDLLNNNLLINREYSETIENINKSLKIALEKNSKQINIYYENAEKEIELSKTNFLIARKKHNNVMIEEQKSFKRITTENSLTYDEEISHIQKEITDVMSHSHIETQKLVQEKSNKLETIEQEYIIQKNIIIEKLDELKNLSSSKINELKEIIPNELKIKDESYLSIKKTHTQTSVKLNEFINNLKVKFHTEKENLNNDYFITIDTLNKELQTLKTEYEKQKETIQNSYLEKVKALNVVFDVQKDVYNQKTTEIINKNNESVTSINRELRNIKEQLNKQIKLLEKEKFQELSKSKKNDERDEINRNYNKELKLLNNQILLNVNKNAEELKKQEFIFQTELFNHDHQHIKQINEWRYSKNLYDMERKLQTDKVTADYNHKVFIIDEKKNLEKDVLDLVQQIKDLKLEKNLLPIETQLFIASNLQNREINLLNLEFESNKLQNELNQKLVEKNFFLEEISLNHSLEMLNTQYYHDKRIIDITYQLEIEKEILKRDNTVSILNMNIDLQKSLLKQKNDRYYRILQGTIKRETLQIDILNKEFQFFSTSTRKKAKIEHEKRSAIIQEIKSKNQNQIVLRKNQRNILIEKNEAETREKINDYFFSLISKFYINEEKVYNLILNLIEIPVHPEIFRKVIKLAIEYSEVTYNNSSILLQLYIKDDKDEFDKRLFGLTDYKYRLKHEEILDLYNDNMKVIDEKQHELRSKKEAIVAENNELKQKITHTEYLIKTYKSTSNNDLLYNEQLNVLLNDIKDYSISQNTNNGVIKAIEKELRPLTLSLKKNNLEKTKNEYSLSKEKNNEEFKYKKLFKKHERIYNYLNVYLENHFYEIKKRYSSLLKTPYLNDTTIAYANKKFALLFKKHYQKMILVNQKLLSFWLNLFITSKDEQSIIIKNFDESTKSVINQIKRSYNKFINIEENEKQVLNNKYELEIKNLKDELKEKNEKTIEDVKITNITYNNVYSETEKKINEINLKNKYKLQLVAENLDEVLNNLSETLSVTKNNLRKSNEKLRNKTLLEISSIKKDILDNAKKHTLKSNTTIKKFEDQRISYLSKMNSRRKKLITSITKYNEVINQKNHECDRNIQDNLKQTKNIKRHLDLTLKTFKSRSRFDQNRLTRKERNTLKKSYRFKAKQIKSKHK